MGPKSSSEEEESSPPAAAAEEEEEEEAEEEEEEDEDEDEEDEEEEGEDPGGGRFLLAADPDAAPAEARASCKRATSSFFLPSAERPRCVSCSFSSTTRKEATSRSALSAMVQRKQKQAAARRLDAWQNATFK